jgi:hypothetical protein
LRQPIIVGVFSLLLLTAVLPGGRRIIRKKIQLGAGVPHAEAAE